MLRKHNYDRSLVDGVNHTMVDGTIRDHKKHSDIKIKTHLYMPTAEPTRFNTSKAGMYCNYQLPTTIRESI
jgi:hypothetical protein